MTQAPRRGFPETEYESRVDRAQRLMAEASVGAILLTTEPEVRYFTGFLTQFWQSPTRPWFLVIPARGRPIAIIPEIGQPLMAQTWIDDIRTWASPDPDDDGLGLLTEALAGVEQLGIPMGPETSLRMPLNDFMRLGQLLGGPSLMDVTPLLRSLRQVKSEAEIAKIAHICEIASTAFETVPDLFEPGLSVADTFKRFKIALLDEGADDVPYLVGASADGGYGDVISPPGDRAIDRGDVLMMDTGAVYDGYFCDFDRNWAIGEAGDDVRRAYGALYRATDAGLEAARPGAMCMDVFAAMAGVVEEEGFSTGNVGRFGHGLGSQLTEPPSFTPRDSTVLSAGMVMTLEPGVGIAPGKTMVHEENIVVTESGARLLSRRAPSELPVLEADR